MKTTVEIPDDLFRKAKAIAASERTTLRALIVEGLRGVLARRRETTSRFELRDAGVPGWGVQPGIDEGDWDGVRDLA